LERLCDLYFELSNEDRLEILHKLLEDEMNVTSIARELGMTTQETSRHISRLSEALLVEKDPDGFFGLTTYGRLSLRLIPGQKFIAEHRDYFNNHTLEKLSSGLVCRIGNLQKGKLTPDAMVTFSMVESLFRGAEEYIWMIHDQYLLSILPLGAEALRRGVKFKSLDTTEKEPHRRLDHGRPYYINEADEEFFKNSWLNGTIEMRFSDSIDIFLYVSDKEAVIAFPLNEGSFDYIGFTSDDQVMRKYCHDLFEFYWEKGKEPTREMVMEAHNKRMRLYREEKENK
jgi:predicted transcriptional regulator